MEAKTKRLSTAKQLSSDRISDLPPTITETILCLVPIKDAVRTSILSKQWRYSWAKIPNLVFEAADYLFDENEKCRFFCAIHQVLLLHDGPILEFALNLGCSDKACVAIDQIILHLSRKNTVTKFKLSEYFDVLDQYSVPLSIFTFHQLTDLYLRRCSFLFRPPLISGFRSLTSLSLIRTRFYKSTLLHFLSSCPLLKNTTLIFIYDHVDESDDSTYTDLLKSIPVVEHLSVNPEICESFSHDMVQPELPSALVHLKYFCLDGSAFLSSYQLDLVFLQAKSSPGLEKINIEMSEDPEEDEDSLDSLILVKLDDVYSDISLKNLKELKIQNFINHMNELNFAKFILTKSPMLKKVWIILNNAVTKDEGLKICNILLDSPRASPIVDIIVEHRQKEED